MTLPHLPPSAKPLKRGGAPRNPRPHLGFSLVCHTCPLPYLFRGLSRAYLPSLLLSSIYLSR